MPQPSVQDRDPSAAAVELPPVSRRIALVGNPNTGKTTLFNRLCGIRAKTANFPGSTVEARIGHLARTTPPCELVDLPGHYGLNLDRPESELCRKYLRGEVRNTAAPDAVMIVVDATNLARNLVFVSQALQQGLPAIVALNMSDLAQRRGLSIDTQKLSEQLDCPVVAISARSGRGIDELIQSIPRAHLSSAALPDPTDAHAAGEWAENVVQHSLGGEDAVGAAGDTVTDRLDSAFTHPVLGIVVFAAIMTGLFYAIFTIATVPMDLIDLLFVHVGGWIESIIPPGIVQDFLVDGVISGIAGTVIFLPQIVLLFFILTLLEDTGYLARAAFVMDRVLRRFGLPGQAFVPLLSAHACAIPAIMSTRLIPDPRDRLATILVAPFLSCTARVPVYVLMIGLLFADQPLLAGLAFTGCYVLGAIAALLSSLIARRTFLRGPSPPMVLELPTYKLPSLRTAIMTTIDRAVVFLRQAGTVIVCICIVLWWLGEYPRADVPAEIAAMHEQAHDLEASDPTQAAELAQQADSQMARYAKRHSFVGMIGRTVEPVFQPLGYDWQLSVGVLSSLLAREVFVSTMVIVVTGSDEDPTEDESVRERLVTAQRTDGSPLFTTATAASLLVYYVLAMQCLPTLAVTRRETGSWKWAAVQLGYMTGLAYVFALLVYHGLRLAGVS